MTNIVREIISMINLTELSKSQSPDFLALNHDQLGEPEKKPSKMRNIVQEIDGERYGSKKEAKDAQNFSLAVRQGEYYLYIHHFIVKLPGSIKMELDHLLINNKLEIEVYETKALDKKGKFRMTRDWRNKQKLFEATYGIKIKII